MAFFGGLLKGQTTLTLTQLQNQIISKNCKHNNQAHSPVAGAPSKDLKIVSPFYKRIDQHPQNCKCVYHKRMQYKPKAVGRCHTQPNQIINQTLQIQNKPEQAVIEEEAMVNIEEYKGWKQKLSRQQLEQLYEQYAKTLKSSGKIKRLKLLDCYNAEFQKFLKNNYLIILDKKKNEDLKYSKDSKRFRTQENFEGKNGNNQYGQKGHSSQEGCRQKKIFFKNNSRQYDYCGDGRKQKRKNTKFYSSRPSFFGLIDEQELIREICLKFMHQNKNQNREGEQMVRQLVESDIDLYTKIMKDINANLEDGIILPNLNEQQSKVLVKIVLKKIGKQVNLKKKKDSQYMQKSEILQSLHVKFGWKKQEKPIGLHQFWKYTQSMKNFGQSRISIGTEKDGFMKDLKKNGLSYSNSQKRSKDKGKGKRERDSQRSQFFNQKNGKKNSNMFASTSSFVNKIEDISKDKIEEQVKPVEQFRFNNTKTTAKRGVLVKRKQAKKQQNTRQSSKWSPSDRERTHGLVRKETCFYEQISQKDQAQFMELKDQQQKNFEQLKSESNQRNSSIYAKNQVLKHIQANKKFLKRIQHQLLDHECHQFVIGIDAGIITKKRKIRALYNALEDEQIQQSVYYNDLIKYLQIYDQYCDLVVKMKKEKKIKSQISLTMLSQQHAITKIEQQQQINQLLDDIKKQRQLKYFELKGLQQKQDPLQELIIKIPQYTTTKLQRIMPNKLPDRKIDDRLQFGSQLTQKNEKETSILQRDLEHKVNMSCRIDLSNETSNSKVKKKKTLLNVQVPQKKKPLDKLEFYRKALKLYTCKTEHLD